MIREEYLASAASVNLIAARNLRDVSVIAETGFRCVDFNRIYAYERIRIYLELLMRDVSAAATGLVKPRIALVSEYTLTAETKTAEQTGVAIAADITPAENRALARSAPPVGRLGGVYESTKAAAAKGERIAKSLYDSLSALYDGCACGRILHTLSVSAIEALCAAVDEAGAAFSLLCADKTPEFAPSDKIISALTKFLCDSFDPVYEADIRKKLEAFEPHCLSEAACAAVRGAKCTQPPLVADLILRYSAI